MAERNSLRQQVEEKRATRKLLEERVRELEEVCFWIYSKKNLSNYFCAIY